MRAELKLALQGLPQPVALSLSGGTDSLCLLFTMLEVGILPVCYNYVVDGFPSGDSARAKVVCQANGLILKTALIPNDLDAVIADVRTLIASGIRGKVGIQCMHGHMKLAPAVTERIIVNGSGVDGLYGSYKQFAFDGSHTSKAIFDAHRAKHLQDPNDDAMVYQTECYGRHGAQVVYPYRTQPVVDWLMARSYAELMKPRYKAATVAEFPEFREYKHLYRPRGSQQIEAGTRALHERLLSHSINRGHSRVQEVYKDMEAGLV